MLGNLFTQTIHVPGTLAANIVTPANTGRALELVRLFWAEGRPLPLRSFTAPSPYPPASA